MTHRQYGTMRYIISHVVTTSHVRAYNLTTFGSLLVRGWAVRNGNHIIPTEAGLEAVNQYSHSTITMRKTEGELSERVALLLSLKNNIRSIKRAS